MPVPRDSSPLLLYFRGYAETASGLRMTACRKFAFPAWFWNNESMFGKLRNFFIESRQELRQVQWPSRQEAIYLTIVVVVVSAILAAFLGGLDAGFAALLQKFLIR
jgi:preprotein translocase subunit SecE